MRFDALVVGGSYAGLSAAMYLARGRRSACVVDAGSPRNRFAAESHGFFGQDGLEPGAMLAAARAQVAAYPTTMLVDGEVTAARSEADGFRAELASGELVDAARLVLAFGVSDELPAISGLRERWGSSVLHCPYCHGYELSGRRLGVLNLSLLSFQQAMMVAEWGPTTFFANGSAEVDDALLAQVEEHGIAIEPVPVTGLHGDGVELSTIELADGRAVEIDVLYLGPRTRLNSDIAERLGCELEDGPHGAFIRTDPQQATTVPGVFAAGDIARGGHNATWASADGVTAGIAVHRSLVL